MTITSIISAIGNNNSIYPLLVRDCGIEVPTKIALTYEQNKKESKKVAKLAARERFLDEYSVSAVWLGGIPLVGAVSNWAIRKMGYCPDVNLKLFNKNGLQNIENNIKNFKEKAKAKGFNKELVQKVIDDLEKVKNSKAAYEKLLAGKFLASTLIPIAFMGFILPKVIFASSAKKIEQQRALEKQQKAAATSFGAVKSFEKSINFMNKKPVSFKGNWVSTVANFSTVDKMFATDGGYALGRVTTARNKNEAIDVGFKMTMMMFLNFIAPKYIEKYLDKFIGKAAGLDVALDPLMINDKEFLEKIKNNALDLPKGNSEKEILEFIDNNPNSLFVKFAQKFKKIKMLDPNAQEPKNFCERFLQLFKKKQLVENGVRDPRAFVDIDNLVKFIDNIKSFEKNALSAKSLEKYAQKAKIVKSANILTNIGLSSFLLAYALPKAQFAFRKLVTGSDLEPGLASAADDK